MGSFSLGATTFVLLTALMVGSVAGKDKQGMGPGAWIGGWSVLTWTYVIRSRSSPRSSLASR